MTTETYQTLQANHADRWDDPATWRDYRAGWFDAERFARSSDGPRDKGTAAVYAVDYLAEANRTEDTQQRMRLLGKAARYFTL